MEMNALKDDLENISGRMSLFINTRVLTLSKKKVNFILNDFNNTSIKQSSITENLRQDILEKYIKEVITKFENSIVKNLKLVKRKEHNFIQNYNGFNHNLLYDDEPKYFDNTYSIMTCSLN